MTCAGAPGTRLRALITLSMLASLAAFMLFTGPESHWWIPGCPFHELTGLFCPGCGSMRALDLLVAGRLSESLRSNALLTPSLVLILTGLAAEIVHPGRAPFRVGCRSSLIVGKAFLIAVVVFTVIRNLPLELSRWLIPA
ncbi:MAG: DUF2752 domain-containing protein [Candidatus Fermentibacter sp.]|nr:DUF2752 domain-containing protein [Candidatus Fermentibacter sp.]